LLFHDIYSFSLRRGILSKHPGVFRGEKRRKEISRQKKQEERRQRRFHKEDRSPSETEKVDQEEREPANSELNRPF